MVPGEYWTSDAPEWTKNGVISTASLVKVFMQYYTETNCKMNYLALFRVLNLHHLLTVLFSPQEMKKPQITWCGLHQQRISRAC